MLQAPPGAAAEPRGSARACRSRTRAPGPPQSTAASTRGTPGCERNVRNGPATSRPAAAEMAASSASVEPVPSAWAAR
ncbi:hypothetical protein PSR1_03454 [Anaeromyxobacter sp. PSR-1]|nr:hypothetical protein PSR1_03454 [Anaeromyxobacter sp. PSR-1]